MKFKIFKFKSIKSTNEQAIKLIKVNKKKLGLVISDIQTNGRGSYGKKWISKKGNFFGSFFFPLKKNYPSFDQFSTINPVIVSELIKSFCDQNKIRIKFPNDIFLNGKKICGILQEIIVHKKEKYLITGIGINTKISPPNKDFKFTSLKNNSSQNISNKIIIDKIIKNYDKLIYDVNNYNSLYIKKKYK